MVYISWLGAAAYCEWATRNDPGWKYGLPTEAWWEYACRAGTQTEWFWGENEAQADGFAWSEKNAGGVTHPVGEKEPNPWGLYDISGLVREWCADWFDENYYASSPATNPSEHECTQACRVLRGGSFHNILDVARSAFRNRGTEVTHGNGFGFRVSVIAQDS